MGTVHSQQAAQVHWCSRGVGEQAHAANTAMSFLLHAERQLRGVADGQRSASLNT